jgi:hypothetical protein
MTFSRRGLISGGLIRGMTFNRRGLISEGLIRGMTFSRRGLISGRLLYRYVTKYSILFYDYIGLKRDTICM